MDKTKLTTLILIAIIVILSSYTVFSGSRRQKEIKRLTQELEIHVDSLKQIQSGYDSIYIEYLRIYNQLDSTKSRFTSFYHQVDSISHSTVSSIDKLKKTIDLMKKENTYFARIDTTKLGPIFQ